MKIKWNFVNLRAATDYPERVCCYKDLDDICFKPALVATTATFKHNLKRTVFGNWRVAQSVPVAFAAFDCWELCVVRLPQRRSPDDRHRRRLLPAWLRLIASKRKRIEERTCACKGISKSGPKLQSGKKTPEPSCQFGQPKEGYEEC